MSNGLIGGKKSYILYVEVPTGKNCIDDVRPQYPSLMRSYLRHLRPTLQRYVTDIIFLYNQDCTYAFVHISISVSTMSDVPMETRMVLV
jgi:hypothetical protein